MNVRMSIVNARSRVCGSGSGNPKNEFVYFSGDTNPVSGVATEASCAAHVIKSSVYTITDVDQAITLRNPRFMGLLKYFSQQNGFQPPDTTPARTNVNPPQTACAAALSSIRSTGRCRRIERQLGRRSRTHQFHLSRRCPGRTMRHHPKACKSRPLKVRM